MSFLVAAALGIALLVALPAIAHRLRRGQTRLLDFPPVSLVLAGKASTERRGGLHDRALLALRVAMVLALAVLGATPLVRCSRLSLARKAGASIAMAIVLDDSLSMRTRTVAGATRWEVALGGARELLASAREGDAISVVLAGRPARLHLAPTTDLGAARDALDHLRISDRGTDLGDAVQLARTALARLAQPDRRVIVLSDLATEPLPPGAPEAWTPLPALHAPRDDCGIASARREGTRVGVELGCTSEAAARGRKLSVRERGADGNRPSTPDPSPTRRSPADAAAPSPSASLAPSTRETETARRALAQAALAPNAGEQVLWLDVGSTTTALEAVLDGADALPYDDVAPVAGASMELLAGVVADATRGTTATGGATVLEQAISALGVGVRARPLPGLPEDDAELGRHAALFIDDPAGLAPATRAALERFITQGGVAVAFLGPRAASAQLAARLEPFLGGGVVWEPLATELGMSASSLAWLGAEGRSLDAVSRGARARLEGSELPDARVIGRWQDGAAWLLERPLGRGLGYAVGLPVSVELSDWALRPAFVAFLEHVIEAALERRGPTRTLAGIPWRFSSELHVTVSPPEGDAVTPTSATDTTSARATPGGDERDEHAVTSPNSPSAPSYTPLLRGAYVVRVDRDVQERIVTLDPRELTANPRATAETTDRLRASTQTPDVDASPQLAWLLLALFFAELLLRLRRRPERRG